ncbi:MAG: hypothetical protein ACK53H_10225, partial [Betaproteobacteria bacterium]
GVAVNEQAAGTVADTVKVAVAVSAWTAGAVNPRAVTQARTRKTEDFFMKTVSKTMDWEDPLVTMKCCLDLI